jgi:hypothetical protein
MLVVCFLLYELGEYTYHWLRKLVCKDHFFIVLAQVHQVVIHSHIVLGYYFHEALHLEYLNHALSVNISPFKVDANVNQKEESIHFVLNDLARLWV